MKRFLAIILILAVTLFVFAACKKDQEDDNTGDPSQSESESESGSEGESTKVEYFSTDVKPASPGKGSADLPEVPLLPDGQLPFAE